MDTSAVYDHETEVFDIAPNLTTEERMQIEKDVELLHGKLAELTIKEKIVEVLGKSYSDELKADFIVCLFNDRLLDEAKKSDTMIKLINNVFISPKH